MHSMGQFLHCGCIDKYIPCAYVNICNTLSTVQKLRIKIKIQQALLVQLFAHHTFDYLQKNWCGNISESRVKSLAFAWLHGVHNFLHLRIIVPVQTMCPRECNKFWNWLLLVCLISMITFSQERLCHQ
jgi:hypothetical protein